MHIGMVGLGRMGMNMARRLLGNGHEVAAYNRTPGRVRTAVRAGARGAGSLEELAALLPQPRVVWIMVPSGAPVDEVIGGLKGHLAKGDIIIDGGNTHYRDDLKRAEELSARGIRYVDAGTSGGVWGLEAGYCLMVGGGKKTFDYIEPVLKTLAPPDGYLYCGPTGAGHFMKMVHNGIEYALMEAYAEGFELVKASEYGRELELAKLARLWNNGSVIRSWLLELIAGALGKDPDLASIAAYVEDSGEGRWTVKEGVDLGVSLPAITAALQRRFRSRDKDSFAEKLLAAMRKQFGGHAVKIAGRS